MCDANQLNIDLGKPILTDSLKEMSTTLLNVVTLFHSHPEIHIFVVVKFCLGPGLQNIGYCIGYKFCIFLTAFNLETCRLMINMLDVSLENQPIRKCLNAAN